MINYDSGLNIFSSTLINDRKYLADFATRAQGDARQIARILEFIKTSNIPYQKIVTLGQIHSTNIAFFDSKLQMNIEHLDDTDGVITKMSNVILTVITADCAPIIFVDKKSGIIGISHQGWRGSLKKLAVKMVELMLKHGAEKASIKVAIGPSIGSCCYSIDDDRYYSFLEEFDGYSAKIFHMHAGVRYLNLMLLNYLLLVNAGLKKENIDFFPFCTRCDKKRFFSFRRDKKSEYGEMFSFVTKLS